MGQVALSKPKSRRAVRSVQKRELDSDDEDEVDQDRLKEEETTPRKMTRSMSKVSARVDVPSISVQQPTPKKGLTKEETEISITETEVDSNIDSGVDDTLDGSFQSNGSFRSVMSVDGTKEESIVPSPSTEEELPTFALTPQSSVSNEAAVSSSGVKEAENNVSDDTPGRGGLTSETGLREGEGKAVRVLHPTALFDEITLWTPDGPLAGFRPDEGVSIHTENGENGSELAVNGVKDDERQTRQALDHVLVNESERNGEDMDVENGVQPGSTGHGQNLAKGWWRIGGAGEGGDEFVRAMGEWIGLVEMVSWSLTLSLRHPITFPLLL